MASLKEGDKIPTFALLNQDGVLVQMKDYLGEKNMVIYFYPKDDTPGCTAEACSFRDAFEEFKDHNCEVFGISADDVNSHKNFAEKHQLSFHLLSDKENKVRNQFGVPGSILGIFPGRVTYVVDKSATIRNVFNSQMNARKHIANSLQILEKIES